MKVYVVSDSHGDYSDHTESNVCVCRSEDKAKEIVKKLEELQEFNCAFAKQLDENVRPYYSYDVYKLPAQPSASPEYIELNKIKKITPELKAIHKRLQQEHNARLSAWNKECENIQQLRNQAHQEYEAKRKQWITYNYNPPAHLNDVQDFVDHGSFTSIYNDTRYLYNKVEFVEET
jgi:hypothetical protein